MIDLKRNSKQKNYTAEDLRTLAAKKYVGGDYQGAIDAFRKSLEKKEDWYSYCGLGMALLNTNQFKKSIEALRKSVALKENWNTYQGLGWAFFRTNQYPEAIDAFRKSLALKEYWNSYHGLGRALCHTNQYSEAIDAFQKTVEVVDTSSVEQVTCAFSALGEAYKKVGDVDAAIRCWEKQISCFKPIYSFDPFLGNKETYEHINSNQLEQLKSTFENNGIDFIPSFKIENDASLESWKYLLYLHIRKCGGTSFAGPLYLLKQHIVNLPLSSPNSVRTYPYLNISRHLVRGEEVPALKNLISYESCKDLKSIFLTTHGATWSELHEHISKTIKARPRIVTTVRDPRQRLFSQIKHDAMIGTPIKSIHEMIDRDNSDYENVIYRYIFDYGLEGMFPSSEYGDGELKPEIFDQIDVVDISDALTMKKIKSAFLSASVLPNIIHYSRLNESKDRAKFEACKLSSQEVNHAFQRCLDKGFVAKDEAIDYDFLKRKTLNRLNLTALGNDTISKIHPLTFIIANTSSKDITAREDELSIIPTKQLINEPLQIIHKFKL